MTRRQWLFLLAGLLLLGLAAGWFYTHFEQVTVKTHAPPEAEARRNPYLALERFFARMGRPLQRQADARFLDTLPAGGVLILDAARRIHMTPERVEHLLRWVEQGGYLIVSPDFPGEDPLLARFGVSRFIPGQSPEKSPATEEEADAVAPLPASGSLTVRIPGAPRPFLADPPTLGLQPGKIAPSWTAGRPRQGTQYLHFAHGSGHVTLISGLSSQFSNFTIGQHDHAEILWTLVQTYQPHLSGPITLVTRLQTPSLWQWLAEYAWTALISGLALLLLWLWRVVPRFGVPQPDPEPDRRQLREHLAAVGRYVWRSGGLEYWLAIARDSFQSRLALRHPAIAALPPAEQAEALARLTRRSAAQIAEALLGPAGSVSSFTSAMRTLRNLERSI